MKFCRMISIDSSTTSSAYAIFDNGVYKKSSLIICSGDMDERFKEMSLSFLKIFNKYKPDIIYIEDTVVPRNVQTQRFLTRLQGVIYSYCILNDCEFNTIRPTEWRKLVGITQGKKKKRNDLKNEAINLIKEKFNMDVNDDEAESVLIGLAVINKFTLLEEKKRD